MGTRDATARNARVLAALPWDREHAPAGSGMRHSARADWRRHGRRYIRWNRSGISPRCSVRACFDGVDICGCKLKGSWRPGLQRAALDEGIGPSPQRRDMDVDPVLPPVERARVVGKSSSLFGHQRVRELLDVFRGEVVFIQQNKGLK